MTDKNQNTEGKTKETTDEKDLKGHPKDSVNEPLPTDDFDSDYGKIAEEFKLYKGLKWTIWEHVEFENKKGVDWDKLYRKVAWFDNAINFHQVWNRIPHAKLSNILYDGESN